MSQLTRCNHCTLEAMRRQARKRGVDVVIFTVVDGPMTGWTAARYTNESEPVSYFQAMPVGCVC